MMPHLITTIRGVINVHLRGMVMTFTFTSRHGLAVLRPQCRDTALPRMDPYGQARGPHGQGRRNNHCCPPAVGTGTPRGPGKPGSPRKAENDALEGAGDASLTHGHPSCPASISRRRGSVSLSSQRSRQCWRSPFRIAGWREARTEAGTFPVVAFPQVPVIKFSLLSPRCLTV